MHALLLGQPIRNEEYDLVQLLRDQGYDVTKTDGVDQLSSRDVDRFDFIVISEDTGCTAMITEVIELRRMTYQQPILCIAQSRSRLGSVRALNMGADDFVTAGITSEELLCRVSAVLRRSNRCVRPSTRLIGNIYFDQPLGKIVGLGKVFLLPKKEHELLNCLVEKMGETVSRQRIMSRLYGQLDRPDPKILNVFVCKLRKRLLETSAGAVTVTSVRDEGYVLKQLSARTPQSYPERYNRKAA